MKFRIGVIGAGVAGLTAAYILQRKHDVTLFEKNDYIGGHTRTVVVPDGPDAGTPIDTGFIVLNDQTYPTLNRFLERLGVSVRFSDMCPLASNVSVADCSMLAPIRWDCHL